MTVIQIVLAVLSFLVWVIWTLFIWVPSLNAKLNEWWGSFLFVLWWGIQIFGAVAVLVELTYK